MFRQQNVTSICAIHDSLCKVDPGAGDVCPLVHISDVAHGPAVDSHPQMNLGINLKRCGNFERTLDRRFRSVAKNQRHPITRWNPDQHTLRL
jgi:hypothetical protein